jgi:hypothetical protein
MWNRHPHNERWAAHYEKAGATVIVAENGWVGKIDGCKPIALARGHHNGAGTWESGDEDRWPLCGVELQPWRIAGDHILVLPQRGYGERGVGMPSNWLPDMLRRLQSVTRRRVVVRHHPGVENPKDPDFTDAWAAVVWGSGAGIKALAAGIPVFYDMPKWIGGAAAVMGVDDVEACWLGDRLPMFRRLAWAQWSPGEIQTGEALAGLLGCAPPSS